MKRDKDSEYRRLIHTARWQRLRKWKLTRNPLCERCEREGRLTAAREVHHVRPVETGMNGGEKERLMYDPANLMALCHDCHVREHTEMGRTGKAAAKRINASRREEILRRLYGEGESQGERQGDPGDVF